MKKLVKSSNVNELENIEKYFSLFSEETKLTMVKDLYKQNKDKENFIKNLEKVIDKVIDNNEYDLIELTNIPIIFCDDELMFTYKQMIDYLTKNKILDENEEPYEDYLKNRCFELIHETIDTAYGERTFATTYVTAKGQVFIIEKLRELYDSQAE